MINSLSTLTPYTETNNTSPFSSATTSTTSTTSTSTTSSASSISSDLSALYTSAEKFENFNNLIKFNILEILISRFLSKFIPSEFPNTNKNDKTIRVFLSQSSQSYLTYTSSLFNNPFTQEEVKQNICNLFNWELEQFENYINQGVIKVIPYPGGLAMGYDEISYDYYMYEINTFDLLLNFFMN